MFKPNQKLVFFDFETTGLNVNINPEIGCFPIELAMLVTDHELNIISEPIKKYIYWENDVFEKLSQNWDKLPATKVHNIKYSDIINMGVSSEDIVDLIHSQLYNLINDKIQLILVSDNPYFDYTLLHKLYNARYVYKFPFHYNCYSPLMLFKSIGMDIKNCKTHRALDDVNYLYKSCVIAFDRLGRFEKEKLIEK